MSPPVTQVASSRIDVAVGARLRKKRESKGIAQGYLASALGISLSTLSRYENGIRPMTVETLAEAAAILQCDPGDFFNGIK